MFKGYDPSIVNQNMKDLKSQGMTEKDATLTSLAKAGKETKHPSRHKNLGKYLHAKKTASESRAGKAPGTSIESDDKKTAPPANMKPKSMPGGLKPV